MLRADNNAQKAAPGVLQWTALSVARLAALPRMPRAALFCYLGSCSLSLSLSLSAGLSAASTSLSIHANIEQGAYDSRDLAAALPLGQAEPLERCAQVCFSALPI